MSLNRPAKLDVQGFEAALADLEKGLCVAIPTETVYGLAADSTNGKAVAQIFAIKERPSFNPLICHVDGIEMAGKYGELSPLALRLAEAFWPGPLTIVVPLKTGAQIADLVTAGLGSIGLRHPKGISSDLISRFGKPLAAPSANRSGRVSPTTADHVAEEFPDIDLTILDQGACDVGLESTIVKVENETLTLLRPGAVTADMIKDVTGVKPEQPVGRKIEAPGMMESHYAPNARVHLNVTHCETSDAWLQFGANAPAHAQALNLSKTGDLIEAAANLYGMLKQLDKSGVERISVSPIPETGIGIAVNDRLRRAAAPRQ